MLIASGKIGAIGRTESRYLVIYNSITLSPVGPLFLVLFKNNNNDTSRFSILVLLFEKE
jgi:hypothetical protein